MGGEEGLDEIIDTLSTEEKIVLIQLYRATRGAPSANVSIQTILRGINPKIVSTLKLKRGKVRKILNKLVRKRLAREKGGRRANQTYSITTLGARIARKLLQKI